MLIAICSICRVYSKQ